MESKAPDPMGGNRTASLPSNGDHHFVPSTTPAMRALERTMADIAATDMPVLVIGESGTGKGAIAYRIHQLSRRRNQPFVKMNCAALSGDFLNGPFSNGSTPSVHETTLFLDEIGELDAALQSKLVYALPDGDLDEGEQCLGARIISATQRNLEKEMRGGRFREDLYFRLSGVCLRLPLLRQRKEDIPALAEHFLTKYAALFSRRKPDLTPQTLHILLEHTWPGNIRELEHAMQKVVALGDERVALADLRGTKAHEPSPGIELEGMSLKEAARAASRQAERELILKVLSRTRWNRKRAAQELQISYKALLYKLKQIGVDSAG
ncbi:MAG: sigma 54-interacting transcriptional regulator [Acidobacteriia bacterium]|nr:sigma 54-interacting transcriptional regulator [Terriglobia bacterium]